MQALAVEELAGSLAAAGVDLKSVDPKDFVLLDLGVAGLHRGSAAFLCRMFC